jgi:hypothetical protein
MRSAKTFALFSLLAIVAVACSDADEPAAPICTEFLLDKTFELVDSAQGTQVQLDAALGRDRIWVAYNMVSGQSSNLDVFLSAISCAGKPLGPPVRVNTIDGRNNVDPVLRVSGEAIFVVWSSDNQGGGSDNLDIVYRSFKPDGSPRMASQRDLETTHAGKPVAGNHWLPNAVLVDDRTLAIVGVRGIPEAPSFQSFVQQIDADGDLVGTARSLKVEADHSHGFPDIGRDAAGRLYTAWERSAAPDFKTNLLAQVRLEGADLSLLDSEPQNLLGGSQQTSKPRYGRRQRADEPLLLTFGDPQSGKLLLLDASKPQAGALELGGSGQPNHLPAASSAGDKGLLGWHRVVKGTVNETVVQGFSLESGAPKAVGAERVLSSEALPYGPTVLHVAGQTYFVGWTATQAAADRKALGRFITL